MEDPIKLLRASNWLGLDFHHVLLIKKAKLIQMKSLVQCVTKENQGYKNPAKGQFPSILHYQKTHGNKES